MPKYACTIREVVWYRVEFEVESEAEAVTRAQVIQNEAAFDVLTTAVEVTERSTELYGPDGRQIMFEVAGA